MPFPKLIPSQHSIGRSPPTFSKVPIRPPSNVFTPIANLELGSPRVGTEWTLLNFIYSQLVEFTVEEEGPNPPYNLYIRVELEAGGLVIARGTSELLIGKESVDLLVSPPIAFIQEPTIFPGQVINLNILGAVEDEKISATVKAPGQLILQYTLQELRKKREYGDRG